MYGPVPFAKAFVTDEQELIAPMDPAVCGGWKRLGP